MRPWYYYLHENGELIGKNPTNVDADPEFFNSTFVRRVWKIDLDSRPDAWAMVLEATIAGANIDRIRDLYVKWSLTKEDSFAFLMETKATPEQREGLKKFVTEILGETEDEYIKWFLDKKKLAAEAEAKPADAPEPKPAAAAEVQPARPATMPRPAAKPPQPDPGPGAAKEAPANPPENAKDALSPKPRPEPQAKPDPAYTGQKQAEAAIPAANQPEPRTNLERVRTFLADVKALRITKHEEATIVKTFIDKARKYQRDVEAEHKPEILRLKDDYERAKAKMDEHLQPLKEAERFANEILTKWLVEERQREIEAKRKADEDRRKIEDEQRRKADEEVAAAKKRAEDERIERAAQAKADGKEQEAQKILQMPLEDIAPIPKAADLIPPPPPPVPVPQPAPKLAGATLRETWKWEVENLDAVPEMFKKTVIDEDAVDGIVSKKKGETKIPGIRVFPSHGTAHRRKA